MIILFCDAFVLQLVFIVFVKSLYEELAEDLESWTHVNCTLTRELVWPTLIGLFSVYIKDIQLHHLPR